MMISSIHEKKANRMDAFKQQWRELGGKRVFVRSKWELRYAMYLQMLKEHNEILDWKHESKTFWFEGVMRGTNNYKPDFEVFHKNGMNEFIEIKGYETAKDRTKWKRMAKYHPEVKLRIVKADWFAKNNPILKNIIKSWE